jgi:hypothetical protein
LYLNNNETAGKIAVATGNACMRAAGRSEWSISDLRAAIEAMADALEATTVKAA